MKISTKTVATVVAVGIALTAAAGTAFAGNFRLAGGVEGIPEGAGYGRATIVCLDKAGDIAKGVTIKTHLIPISGGVGVTFTCP
jgi:hypothetical protein